MPIHIFSSNLLWDATESLLTPRITAPFLGKLMGISWKTTCLLRTSLVYYPLDKNTKSLFFLYNPIISCIFPFWSGNSKSGALIPTSNIIYSSLSVTFSFFAFSFLFPVIILWPVYIAITIHNIELKSKVFMTWFLAFISSVISPKHCN